jgi:hypothetical protein
VHIYLRRVSWLTPFLHSSQMASRSCLKKTVKNIVFPPSCLKSENHPRWIFRKLTKCCRYEKGVALQIIGKKINVLHINPKLTQDLSYLSSCDLVETQNRPLTCSTVFILLWELHHKKLSLAFSVVSGQDKMWRMQPDLSFLSSCERSSHKLRPDLSYLSSCESSRTKCEAWHVVFIWLWAFQDKTEAWPVVFI